MAFVIRYISLSIYRIGSRLQLVGKMAFRSRKTRQCHHQIQHMWTIETLRNYALGQSKSMTRLRGRWANAEAKLTQAIHLDRSSVCESLLKRNEIQPFSETMRNHFLVLPVLYIGYCICAQWVQFVWFELWDGSSEHDLKIHTNTPQFRHYWI